MAYYTLINLENDFMSIVTNVLLKTSTGDKSRIAKLNTAFESGQKFVSCDDDSLPRGWYGGNKMLECEVYPAAFNHLDLEELVRAIRGVEWDDPLSVQLFVQEQEEDRLREVDLGFYKT
jgi:hypothetical protein